MLRGLEKFRILGERPARDGVERYRIARVESIKEAEIRRDGGQPRRARSGSRNCSRESCRSSDHDFIPKDVPDADLVHAIAQHLEPLEKQALLECNSLLERCEVLVELLEMRMMPQGKSRMH